MNLLLGVPLLLRSLWLSIKTDDEGGVGCRTTKNASPAHCSNAMSINSNDNILLFNSVGSVIEEDKALSNSRPGACFRCCSSVISAGNSLLDSLHKDRNK